MQNSPSLLLLKLPFMLKCFTQLILSGVLLFVLQNVQAQTIITAEEESRIIVITVPVIMAVKKLVVSLPIHFFAFSPSILFSVSDRFVSAKRNKPKPPKTDKIISINKR